MLSDVTPARWARRRAKRAILGSRILRGWFHQYHFKRIFGRSIDFSSPQTFNEKVFWRMHLQWDPEHRFCTDKLTVRTFVQEHSSCKLVPLLAVFDDVDSIDFASLPDEFVIKTNHASGNTIVVNEKSSVDLAEIRKRMRIAWQQEFGLVYLETQYLGIERKVLVEQRLRNSAGAIPEDIKIHCFHGVPTIIQIVDSAHQHNTLFTANWTKLEVDYRNSRSSKDISAPANLDSALEAARQLSAHFDYVRVDLYDTQDGVYFGELTFTPNSGRAPFTPTSFDLEMGQYWQIDPH